LKIRPLTVACIASVLLHGIAAQLAGTIDKGMLLKSNLHFSIYRQSRAREAPYLTTSTQGARRVDRNAVAAVAQESLPLAESGSLSEPQPQEVTGAPPEPVALNQYLESDQVLVRAVPLDVIDLNVAEASDLSAAGAMTLKLWINGSGKVVHTEIEKSDFPNAYSNAIATVFSSTVFAPAQAQGVPVNSILHIETRYE
jgi:hypothetical protein